MYMIPYSKSKRLSPKLIPIIIVQLPQIVLAVLRYCFYYFAFKKIGKNVFIGRSVSFGGLYNTEVGNRVAINQGCNLYGDFGISIGDDTKLSPYVQLYSAKYVHRQGSIIGSLGVTGKRVNIGKNVWIGAGSVILSGVTIGDNSIVGALSLVNKNIPKNEIWVGNPARFVKRI